MIFEGFATRWLANQAGQIAASFTKNGAIRVAQLETEGDEFTRAGRRFHFGPLSGVTGIAPVQAIPTTAAQWLLYNPAQSTVTQFIDELGILLVSGTAGAGIVLLATKVFGQYLPSTLPVKSATGMSVDNRGLSNKTSQLVIQSAQTLANAPVGPLFPIAKDDTTNTAVLSVAAMNNDVRGKISLPPGTGLALYVTSPAGTTPLYAPVGSYREVEADNE